LNLLAVLGAVGGSWELPYEVIWGCFGAVGGVLLCFLMFGGVLECLNSCFFDLLGCLLFLFCLLFAYCGFLFLFVKMAL